jgi:phosphoenolpyruvate synthase/pyruvate phosphate dikinase
MTQWVYGFGGERTDGSAGMKGLLGGKGANLAEMAGIGLPVPPGFTISTEVCTYYYANDRELSRRSEGSGQGCVGGGRGRRRAPLRRSGLARCC